MIKEEKWALLVESGGRRLVLADAEDSYVFETPCGFLYFDHRSTLFAETLRGLAAAVIRDTVREHEEWLASVRKLGGVKIWGPSVRVVVDVSGLEEETERQVEMLRGVLEDLEGGGAEVRRLTHSELEKLEREGELEYI